MEKIVIIGNGAAGIETAINIRKLDSESEITLISNERYPHYYRPRLIEYLGGKIDTENFIIYKEDFYEKNRIKNITGEKIVEINTEKKSVISEKNNSYEFTKLMLATGASSFRPPIPGSDLKGVFTLRTIEDADQIRSFVSDKKNIVILGGGILGLEIANSIKDDEKEIVVIEMFDRLLPRQLDNKASSILKNILERKGLNFILGDSVANIGGSQEVHEISLKSGKNLKVQCIIISAGVRSNIELAKSAGIKTNRGIVIDNYFKTSKEDIFAAGDCAEHNEKVYGLWSVSKEQGKLAGMNMAGKNVEYTGSTPSTILKVTGIDLYSGGDFDFENPDQVFTKSENDQYLKLIVKDSRIVGAIALGNKKAVMDFKLGVEGKKTVENLLNYFN